MIIITGATGKLGRAGAERLLERVPADQIGVSVRDPEKAHALAEQGCGCGGGISPTRRACVMPLRAHRRC